MANAPHATTEEQRSQLGRIKRKPMQIDMFTGNLVRTKPKTGKPDGSHVVLKDDDAPIAIPGMAHFAGAGPEGKRCYQCDHCRDLPAFGKKYVLTREQAGLNSDAQPRKIETNACRKAAMLFKGVVQRGGIHLSMACKYFVERG